MFRVARKLLGEAAKTTGPQHTAKSAAGVGSSASPRKLTFAKIWLSDSATYPIMAIIAGASVLVCFQGYRVLTGHPDITFDKDDRSSFIRDNDEDAERHHEHFLRQHARTGNTQIMPGLNKVMVSGRVKETKI